jgi:uncharacterized protein (DUF302 family)
MKSGLGLTAQVRASFGAVVGRVTEALKAEGFGVLTEIDVKETMKRKLGEEYSPYTILGACNPHIAHRALQIAPEIGLLLPCNVVVRQLDAEKTEVSIVNPMDMMGIIGKPELEPVASEAHERLQRVVKALEA